MTFLVDILRQYIVNPYPANDQLMEMMDEEDNLCMDKTALRFVGTVLSIMTVSYHAYYIIVTLKQCPNCVIEVLLKLKLISSELVLC